MAPSDDDIKTTETDIQKQQTQLSAIGLAIFDSFSKIAVGFIFFILSFFRNPHPQYGLPNA